MIKYRIIVLILSSSLFFSCKKDNKQVEDPVIVFDKNQLVNYWNEEIIIKKLNSTVLSFETLEKSISTFELNQNSTNLNQLKSDWLIAINDWKELEIMDIDVFKTQYIVSPHKNIDTWPVDIPFLTKGIYKNGGVPITKNYVENRGTTSKGLHTMEYLLYDYPSENIALDSLKSTKRFNYLKGIVQVNSSQIKVLQKDWTSYKTSFIENPDNTIQLVLNEMVSELEFTKKNRLAVPMGKLNGGFPKGEDVESPFSKTSLSQLLKTIQSSKAYFVCDEITGLDNYIREIESVDGLSNPTSLASIVIQQYDTVIEQIQGLMATQNLHDAIATKEVSEIHDNVEKLLRLIKVDVSNNLGVTIFFSDNDGD